MSAIKKMERAYNCLEHYRNNCNSKEHRQLVDIFFPMLYQENKHHLEISVGKKVSESKFICALSTLIDNFIVTLDCLNDNPQLIIKYTTSGYPIALINLAYIKDLQIKIEEDRDIGICSYNIYFNYNDEIDYHIHIVE